MSARAIDMENPIIISDENTTITAFEVIHEPVSPALGFRIDYKDRSIVISGDTIKDKNVEKFSKDVDVLFHEAQSNYILNNLIEAQGGKGPNVTVLKDIQTYHTTPTEAAEIAKAAKVGHLVFYHLTPAPRNTIMERVFTRGVEEIFPEDWTMAKDGLLVSLPTGTDDINISYLD
jgi:ribonuclease Z